MHLYIDKENIYAFMKSKNLEDLQECTRMIKRNVDVHYNFPKADILKDDILRTWFNMSNSSGAINTLTYSNTEAEVFPHKPFSFKDLKVKDNDGTSPIYLLNDSDSCDKISRHNCILVDKVGSEISLFKRLMAVEEGTEIQAINIRSWDSYCPDLPLTDIILCDDYYFAKERAYKANNNKILKTLASRVSNYPVKVVIMTQVKNVDYNIDLEDEIENLQNIVKDASGNEDSAVTIVLTNNEMHDRNLLTNYYRIKSGSGFQIYQNGVKPDVTVEIKSYSQKQNEKISLDLIRTFQRIINTAAIRFYGDKKSNLLYF